MTMKPDKPDKPDNVDKAELERAKSSLLEIEEVQTPGQPKLPPPPAAEAPPGPTQAEKDRLEAELMVKLQPILLDAAVNMLGNTLEMMTKLQGMNFTAEEHKALVEAWSPILPHVSPSTNAALVTLLVLLGKAAYYMANRPKKEKKHEEGHAGAEAGHGQSPHPTGGNGNGAAGEVVIAPSPEAA